MNIAIVGFGMEGRASYDYFKARGDVVTICDADETLKVPEGAATKLGVDYLKNLDRFDLVLRTAGMHPDVIISKNPGIDAKLSTQINEFFKACPTKNMIGITGTKGKGTTSTLISKILEAAGNKVLLAGNIGEPALSHLKDLNEKSWVVLELSSFQLIDLQHSPHIAVCLLVVPEHLNWHADMNEYMTAKMQLFAHQIHDDIAIYYTGSENSKEIASAGSGRLIPFFETPGAVVNGDTIQIDGQAICKTDELKLLGKHNWQNACAAVTAVWNAGMKDIAVLRKVLTSFTGLPHRIEFVREKDGIRFYNDSFAAGLHATEAAIEAIPGKKVMIVGGFDRMLPLEHFGEFAMQHQDDFRKILVIGESGERFAAMLNEAGFKNYEIDASAKTMKKVVAKARSFAQSGDAVVLSPGFASFDMFKNFEDRGDQFRAVVKAL